MIALMDENDAGRELLQQRRVEQAREAFLRHFGKQRQTLQLRQFVSTQAISSPAISGKIDV